MGSTRWMLLAAVAVLVLGSCTGSGGGTKGEGDAAARLAAADKATRAAGSAHLRSTSDSFANSQAISITVEGRVSLDGHGFDVEQRYAATPPIAGSGQPGSVRKLSDGVTTWTSLGGEGAAPLPASLAGKRWRSEADGRTAVPQVSSLLRHAKGVRRTGATGEGDAQVTTFEMTYDLDAARSAAGASGGPLRGFQLRPGVAHTTPVVIALDAENRIREVRLVFDLERLLAARDLAPLVGLTCTVPEESARSADDCGARPTTVAEHTQSSVTELADFSASVRYEGPPAAEVADAAAYQKAFTPNP